MRHLTVFLVLSCLLASPALGQIGFECSGPPFTPNIFPTGCGAPGNCEGISANNLGVTGIDGFPNGCGFPTSGIQALRVFGAGPINAPIGTVPASLTAANQAYIPIPTGAVGLRFAWDFINTFGGPFAGDNHGAVIDIVDVNCVSLTPPIAFADTGTPLTGCADMAAGGIESGNPGPERVSIGALPSGAAFLRVSVWYNAIPGGGIGSSVVLDDVYFVMPGFAGTHGSYNDDLVGTTTIAGVIQPGFMHTLVGPTMFDFTATSPGGTYSVGETVLVFLETWGCAFAPAPPFIPGEICFGPSSTLSQIAAVGVVPFTVSAAIPALPPLNLCFKLQTVVISPSASNGIFASTNCHEYMLP